VELLALGRLTDAQRAELDADEKDSFGADEDGLDWRDKDLYVVLRGPSGRLVARAGLVLAQVHVSPADEAFAVVGIGDVLVTETERGRGYAREVLSGALCRAATLGPERAMLFCHESLAGMYKQLGFIDVPDPVRVDQADGEVLIDLRTMWRPLSPDAPTWPTGEVRLHGLPF
jgi:predicted GNAT family N-acyltransferase